MFRKYTKAKKSLDITLEQLSKTEAEAEYLTEALTHVELATDVATLQESGWNLSGRLPPAPQKRRA